MQQLVLLDCPHSAAPVLERQGRELTFTAPHMPTASHPHWEAEVRWLPPPPSVLGGDGRKCGQEGVTVSPSSWAHGEVLLVLETPPCRNPKELLLTKDPLLT